MVNSTRAAKQQEQGGNKSREATRAEATSLEMMTEKGKLIKYHEFMSPGPTIRRSRESVRALNQKVRDKEQKPISFNTTLSSKIYHPYNACILSLRTHSHSKTCIPLIWVDLF
jgi:hypothetical protein